METSMKKEIIEKVMRLFEKGKVYLVKDLSIKDLSLMTGMPLEELKSDFEKEFGYSFDEMVDIWRVCHARELLKEKVPYRMLWRFSGFPSRRRMERVLEGIAF